MYGNNKMLPTNYASVRGSSFILKVSVYFPTRRRNIRNLFGRKFSLSCNLCVYLCAIFIIVNCTDFWRNALWISAVHKMARARKLTLKHEWYNLLVISNMHAYFSLETTPICIDFYLVRVCNFVFALATYTQIFRRSTRWLNRNTVTDLSVNWCLKSLHIQIELK